MGEEEGEGDWEGEGGGVGASTGVAEGWALDEGLGLAPGLPEGVPHPATMRPTRERRPSQRLFWWRFSLVAPARGGSSEPSVAVSDPPIPRP